MEWDNLQLETLALKKQVQDIISEINIPNLKINEFARIKIGE